MTSMTVEVITSAQRRRRWSRSEKERIVAAALEPGAVASEVARAAGIHASQLFRWRQQLCGPGVERPTFSPVTVAPTSGLVSGPMCGMIEIELAAGARVRITGSVDPLTVSAAIAALSKAGRAR
jgi:transposase